MRPRLLLLTDRSQLRLGRSLVRTVRECVDAGLAAVVVRELDLCPRARAALVRELTTIDGLEVIAARTPLPGAHAVHLPASAACNAVLPGLPHRRARAEDPITPRYTHAGRSCHSPEEVRRAAAGGAVYATLSPFAASVSKPGYGPVVDPTAYGEDFGIPVYALGGVDPGNAARARAYGAHGVAVMGAVMRAAEPAEVVSDLLTAVAP